MRPCDRVISNMFRIANKEAVTVDFDLFPVQERYSSQATLKDIILKSRREGFSSYIRAEFLTACLTEENTRAVILSQDITATQKHLAEVKYYIKHMKGPKPVIGYDSKNQISFPKTDSSYYIGTAGDKDFGRGDTITHLLLSEAAFYPDLKGLTGSVMQAAAYAKHIVLESTANGFNHFQKMCERARKKQGPYTLHFYAWFEDHANYLPLLKGERLYLLDSDKEIMKKFKLSREQMKWYITKREEFIEGPDDVEGLNLFHQEYPASIEEAFIASGAKFFRTVNDQTMAPIDQDGKVLIYKKPVEGHSYVAGVDYSGGLGQDFGVVQIVDIDAFEQVAIYRDAWTAPSELSHVANRMARMFNMAYIVPELNNHGHLGVDVLKRIYPVGMIYRRQTPADKSLEKRRKQLGFITTDQGKHYACNALKLYLRRGMIIHNGPTVHEILAFEENEGRLTAPEGDFDDCVIGLALAAVGIRKLIPIADEEEVEEEVEEETGPIYPFKNVEDLGDILERNRRGRQLMTRFYGAGAKEIMRSM